MTLGTSTQSAPASCGTGLLSSASERSQRVSVRVPGTGSARVHTYDARGRLVKTRESRANVVAVTVPAGGFALIRR